GSLYYSRRAILINSCLSSIPSYAMGLFLLPETIQHEIDSVRGRFYWEGMGERKRYHMVKWSNIAFPKDFGGLGFTDTGAMNIALLGKWIFKLESDTKSLCMTVLKNKYMRSTGFFQYNSSSSSMFWQGLQKIRIWVERGSKWKVGDGSHIFFWRDVWHGEVPLKNIFPYLFEICDQQDISVKEVRSCVNCLSFRRVFGQMDVECWRELCGVVSSLQNSMYVRDKDEIKWALGTKEIYTSKSMYSFLTFRGILDQEIQNIWFAPIPLKFKHFLWLAWRNRIQSAGQLRKMGWGGNEARQLCSLYENSYHIFFKCPMAVFVWCCCRDALGWERVPSSFSDFNNCELWRCRMKLPRITICLLAS
uniref:Reverse transcriptase zinc-binding domain-containing protein n=1 Tax=Oryza brachyantha TaxID=4533 RepID=J3MPR6_ORYBR